ncbi:MAG: hypothetical protein H8D23_04595 [Candidatus Brocadiales bacterium]|nr:hypothetical protein [Candidatus Brocadiales bacterium]
MIPIFIVGRVSIPDLTFAGSGLWPEPKRFGSINMIEPARRVSMYNVTDKENR